MKTSKIEIKHSWVDNDYQQLKETFFKHFAKHKSSKLDIILKKYFKFAYDIYSDYEMENYEKASILNEVRQQMLKQIDEYFIKAEKF